MVKTSALQGQWENAMESKRTVFTSRSAVSVLKSISVKKSANVLPCSDTADTNDGRIPSKGKSSSGSSPSGRKNLKVCRHYIKGSCTNPSCDYWHPPVCQNYKSDSGCKFGDKCMIRHDETESQSSKRRRGGEVNTFGLRLSGYRATEIQVDFAEEHEIFGIRSYRSILIRNTSPRKKNRERKGPSQRVLQKCAPKERSP